MIQFNLLPDVKLEYMRAERNKRLVTAISIAVTAASLFIVIVLSLIVFVFQKKYATDLSADIVKYSNDLKATPDLNKILTVQNQLNSLTALHQAKPDSRRVLPFIQQVTPAEVSISNLDVKFTDNTVVITGAANSLNAVNKFVDTLKFTQFTKDGQSSSAFSGVVLTSFGRADKGASYTINLSYDPVIFENQAEVTLTVPAKVTTRSELERPTALFEAISGEKEQ